MNNTTGRIVDEAVEAASLYTQAEVDHIKLRVAKSVTTWSVRLITGFVALLMFVLVLIFIGLSGALYLQASMSPEAAYALVALFYASIGFIFFIARKKLLAPLILKNTLTELFDET